MMVFYSEDECLVALTKARVELAKRAEFTEYKRGFNDCFAFLAVYDEYLRGESKAFDKIFFDWDSTKQFQQKLYLRGHTIESYLEYCGYHIAKGTPLLGDVAFYKGAMIYDGNSWVSTTETNEGVQEVRLSNPRRIQARPIRS
jgi:hypothetical protein